MNNHLNNTMTHFRAFLAIIILLTSLHVGSTLAATIGTRSLVIIVNAEVQQQSITPEDLKNIMLGDMRFWQGGKLITLLIQAPVSWERDTLLGQIMEMSESQYRQFWISKVFRAEVASGPKVVLSNEMASILVSKIPGAMAFVNNDEIPAGTRVLRINDLLPEDAAYPLKF